MIRTLLLVLVLSIVSGCNQPATDQIPEEPPRTVVLAPDATENGDEPADGQSPNENIPILDILDNGEMAESSSVETAPEVPLPELLPADCPTLDAMFVLAASQDEDSGTCMYHASVTDIPSSVVRQLRTQAENKGWTEKADRSQGAYNIFDYEKGDRILTLVVAGERSPCNMNVTVSLED